MIRQYEILVVEFTDTHIVLSLKIITMVNHILCPLHMILVTISSQYRVSYQNFPSRIVSTVKTVFHAILDDTVIREERAMLQPVL